MLHQNQLDPKQTLDHHIAAVNLCPEQVASEATSREKALLVNQLSVVEQQLAERSEQLQHKQQQVQQLQVASPASYLSPGIAPCFHHSIGVISILWAGLLEPYLVRSLC